MVSVSKLPCMKSTDRPGYSISTATSDGLYIVFNGQSGYELQAYSIPAVRAVEASHQCTVKAQLVLQASGQEEFARGFAILHDHMLACSSVSGEMRLWDLARGQLCGSFRLNGSRVRFIVDLPLLVSHQIAVGTSAGLEVWQLHSPAESMATDRQSIPPMPNCHGADDSEIEASEATMGVLRITEQDCSGLIPGQSMVTQVKVEDDLQDTLHHEPSSPARTMDAYVDADALIDALARILNIFIVSCLLAMIPYEYD
ncbi:hypothetical protein OH77DRAFT_1172346 [Trametes cingulata]|nr:hypothetical protein OH77DRAFT_1172346 [Trametes cingulata]